MAEASGIRSHMRSPWICRLGSESAGQGSIGIGRARRWRSMRFRATGTHGTSPGRRRWVVRPVPTGAQGGSVRWAARCWPIWNWPPAPSRCPAQASLFTQGEDARCLYLICSGYLKLTAGRADDKQMIVRVAGPGSMLGLYAVLSHGVYEVSAESLTTGAVAAGGARAIPELSAQPQGSADARRAVHLPGVPLCAAGRLPHRAGGNRGGAPGTAAAGAGAPDRRAHARRASSAFRCC